MQKDILNEIFRFLDWISVGVASRVCLLWKDVTINYSRCYVESLYRGVEFFNRQMPDTEKNKINIDYPFQNRDSYALGKLIGCGGYTRVYELGNIKELCLKVSFGGLFVCGESCKCNNITDHYWNTSEKQNPDYSFLKLMYYWTSTNWMGPLCKSTLNVFMKGEYDKMLNLEQFTTKGNKIFPRIIDCGVNNNTCYYIMERIPGITIRTLLRNSSLSRTSDDQIEIDLMDSFIQLLLNLNDIHSKKKDFFHGDLKPENMIINEDWLIRPIDPVKYLDSKDIAWLMRDGKLVSPIYNPKSRYKVGADAASIAMIIFEITTNTQPYNKFKPGYECNIRDENERFSVILEMLQKEFKEKEFQSWLLGWLDRKIDHGTYYSDMVQNLTEWKAKGTTLVRFVNNDAMSQVISEKEFPIPKIHPKNIQKK